jgi:hypothetical protein
MKLQTLVKESDKARDGKQEDEYASGGQRNFVPLES